MTRRNLIGETLLTPYLWALEAVGALAAHADKWAARAAINPDAEDEQ